MMNWILKNWYGVVSWVFLILAVKELIFEGDTMKFWADLIICFVAQTAQAVLNEVRKPQV